MEQVRDRLRPARAVEAAAIADLVRVAFAAQSARTEPPPGALAETAESVTQGLRRGGGAVVERGDRLVGAVLWHEEDGALHVGRLSVHPDCRRQGLARRLMDAAEAEARRRGLPRMTLGVRLALADNRRLFRTCGFEERSLHAHPGHAEPTWVLMERRLS